MLHPYTFNNHFQFGYNRQCFNERRSESDAWWVHYGSITHPIGSFRDEAIAAAKLIRESTDLPIYVLLSGGCDSEVTLRAFTEAKIAVRPIIARYRHDLNLHDVSYAYVAVHTLGLPYTTIDIDIIRFLENDAYDYAEKTQCASAAMCLLMWIMDKIDGFPVIGSGECYLEKQIQNDYLNPAGNEAWAMLEKEHIASLYRFLMSQGRPGVPGFFQYNPELMLAFLKDQLVVDLCVRGIPPNVRSTLPIKNQFYYQYYPEMIKRNKFTGYEMVREASNVLAKTLEDKYASYKSIALTEYNALVHMLEGGQP